MAIIRVYKRNSTFKDLTKLIEELSQYGLGNALQKYYTKPVEKQAKSIVAGPSFLQFLDSIFHIHITPGDIIQFETASHSKYHMLSMTGTWDEIVELN